MLLPAAQALIATLVNTKARHRDYNRTVTLAADYYTLITGDDISRLLVQFVQREDKALFDQRVKVTQSITPAVAAAIKIPFAKVTRNDKVVKSTGVTDEARAKIVDTMLQGFFGNPLKNNAGLDGWMKSVFVDLTFLDPNAWVVVEWTAAAYNQPVKPRPFVVSAANALHFATDNDETQWLFVRQDITYLKRDKNAQQVAGQPIPTMPIPGTKFTLYDMDYTISYTQIDKDYYDEAQIPLAANESIWMADDKTWYLAAWYEPKLGFVPAFRMGYDEDAVTGGRTYVNPFQPAMPYFLKSVKTVSESDLTMTLHTFPQKMQYVQVCPGKSKQEKCLRGRTSTGDVCSVCHGNGTKVHTTTQDLFIMPLPEDPKDMVDLEKLIVYKAPPSDIIKIQLEYIKDLKADAMQATFNSQTFVQPKIVKTATEQNLNMESVYDKLFDFAQKYSELWREIVSVIVTLAALNPATVQIRHAFPSDLKLKTVAMLINELEAINQSNAPAFLREGISDDIANAMYADDPATLKQYQVKRLFFPFGGRSADDIAYAVASGYVTTFDKVLYFNFEKIFIEIGKDDPQFWYKDFESQWKIVGDKVNELMDEVQQESASRFTVSDLTGTNKTKTGTQDGNAAGDNGNGAPVVLPGNSGGGFNKLPEDA